MSGPSPRSHWEHVYRSRATEELSWFHAEPTISLELIARAGAGRDAALVDVGGGASPLVDALVGRGYGDVTVLDVSPAALEIARRRLGAEAEAVTWVDHDVLTWEPSRRFDLWHDRAVFHFLVQRQKRDAYLDVLHRALKPTGSVVVATFAADGPETCSGLPTARYAPDELGAAFGPALQVAETRREEHVTPAGVTQPFTWVLLRPTTPS